MPNLSRRLLLITKALEVTAWVSGSASIQAIGWIQLGYAPSKAIIISGILAIVADGLSVVVFISHEESGRAALFLYCAISVLVFALSLGYGSPISLAACVILVASVLTLVNIRLRYVLKSPSGVVKTDLLPRK